MGIDVLLDCGDELRDTAEGVAPNPLLGEVAEEALDLIEPRAARGHEVDVKAWVLIEPLANLLVLV